MKSNFMISFIYAFVLLTFSYLPLQSAMPETLFLTTKFRSINTIENFTNLITETEGVIDFYHNNTNGLVTIIYDKELLTEQELFEDMESAGFILQKKHSYSSNKTKKQNVENIMTLYQKDIKI
ncbi:MAG: hypothetical protein WC313_04030 [Candidatus Kapaibacterium sp.]|nr:hypothetical protein [Candidatus Kapabacteria bacterium]